MYGSQWLQWKRVQQGAFSLQTTYHLPEVPEEACNYSRWGHMWHLPVSKYVPSTRRLIADVWGSYLDRWGVHVRKRGYGPFFQIEAKETCICYWTLENIRSNWRNTWMLRDDPMATDMTTGDSWSVFWVGKPSSHTGLMNTCRVKG